jgi:hypothetical protein
MRGLGVALAAAGCAGQGPSGDSGAAAGAPRAEGALVTMSDWARGDGAVWADPVPGHTPADASCPEGGALVEGASFEVRTGTCTYGWFQQPALIDLRPGDEVELVFWHSTLVSEEDGQGHVALFVGDDLLFERYVDIPSDPMAYTERVTVGASADEGAIVTLHLHNHGANDWNVLRIERQASP